MGLAAAIGVSLFASAVSTLQQSSTARRAEKRAREEQAQRLEAQKKAKEEQDRRIEEQRVVQEKQARLLDERKASEEAKMAERRTRLSRGRRGLLFESSEAGVKNESDKLGG